MLEFIFVLMVSLVIYSYIGYPFIVWIMSYSVRKKVHKGFYEPSVSIVIAAYNESAVIESTILNKLQLEYPPEKLEIIVVSDGSTDNTDEIVKSFQANNVKLLRQEPRAGKTAALNKALPKTIGEIIVFSDANSMYTKDSLRKLLQNFNDPKVGYVTGKMIYTNPDGSIIGDGCSAYMKYENFLRTVETAIGSIIGVDGGIDAIRKSLYKEMRPDQLPDFLLPLHVIAKGYRVVYEPAAVLQEPALNAPKDEYRMRVRVVLRSLWALYDMRELLLSKVNRQFSWQLWSHKVLRYLCFLFLSGAYCSNFLLCQNGYLYILLFLIQNIGYAIGLAVPAIEKRGYSARILSLLHYFVLLNLASAHAFVKFLMRQKQVTWTPRIG